VLVFNEFFSGSAQHVCSGIYFLACRSKTAGFFTHGSTLVLGTVTVVVSVDGIGYIVVIWVGTSSKRFAS
jgi:hypothetical protein